jgi:hypothetical protein
MRAVALLAAGALCVPGPAHGDGKEPGARAREAVRALKADLGAFEVLLHKVPGRGGAFEDDPTWVKLVADPKKAAAKPKQVFAVSEKQATAFIDYLAESGLLDRVDSIPPGFPNRGWHVDVRGGKPAGWYGHWVYDLDVKPATVGVFQYLAKALDGEAKAAVVGFGQGAAEPKK